MKISFPAMKGNMGKRDFYVAMIKLNLIPKIFSYHDWAELPPEQRAQRVLQKNRIPEITQYILDNEEGYLFSSLTASYDGEEVFRPSVESPELGILELPLDSQFTMNDGQHRMAAIVEALKQNPILANETISVVFFPYEDLDRMQQMFSDLNRTVKVTSKSLNILYDHKDLLGQLVLDAVEKVSVFRNMVDKDRVSLPLRSPKLFTLSAVYDASKELVGVVTLENQDEKAGIINKYWEAVGANIRQWRQVQKGELRPSELRSEYVHSHAVVLWGIGAMGRTLIQEYPTNWQSKLIRLSDIDWHRTNKEWQGVCMQGTDIVNRRQSRKDTASFLKNKMGLSLLPKEENIEKPPNTTYDNTIKDLRFTNIIRGEIGNLSASSWSQLLWCALKLGLDKGMSLDELTSITSLKLKHGLVSDQGYRPVLDTKISMQDVEAKKAAENLKKLAQNLKLRLYVEYEWQEPSPKAGERGLIKENVI